VNWRVERAGSEDGYQMRKYDEHDLDGREAAAVSQRFKCSRRSEPRAGMLVECAV
jgi:hypothetical protein